MKLTVFQFILEVLLPRPSLVRELESMTPEYFRLSAQMNAVASVHSLALFKYSDKLVREAVWQLKYRGNEKVATLMASLLHEEIIGFLSEFSELKNFRDPLLVPIPISAGRMRERGYNQCQMLVQKIIELDGGKNLSVSETALEKTKETANQTSLSGKKDRLENLKGCFKASGEVKNRSCILIDDVTTTGATFAEAKRALRKAGAREIACFAFAH